MRTCSYDEKAKAKQQSQPEKTESGDMLLSGRSLKVMHVSVKDLDSIEGDEPRQGLKLKHSVVWLIT